MEKATKRKWEVSAKASRKTLISGTGTGTGILERSDIALHQPSPLPGESPDVYCFDDAVVRLEDLLSSTDNKNGKDLPILPKFILANINKYVERYSKFSVIFNEKDTGEKLNDFVDIFLNTIVYKNKWTLHIDDDVNISHRCVCEFISSTKSEHEWVKYYLHQEAVHNLYSDVLCYFL